MVLYCYLRLLDFSQFCRLFLVARKENMESRAVAETEAVAITEQNGLVLSNRKRRDSSSMPTLLVKPL